MSLQTSSVMTLELCILHLQNLIKHLPTKKMRIELPSQLFNHYILRGYESGIFYWMLRRYFLGHYDPDRLAKLPRENIETYELQEPQPLEISNVVFCFTFLPLGIGLSLCIALAEWLIVGIPSGIQKQKQKRERRRKASQRAQRERDVYKK